MGLPDPIPGLILLTYGTVTERDGWKRFVDALARTLRTRTATVAWVDLVQGTGSAYYAVGEDAAWMQRYNEHHRQAHLETMGDRVALLEVGRVVPTEQLCPDRELLGSRYYQEFLRPQGLFYGATCILHADPDRVTALNVMRSRRHGPMQAGELAVLEALVPHLQQALAVQRRLTEAITERDVAATLLDELPVGVIVVDAQAVPVQLNRSARELLQSHDGVSLDRQRLRLSSPALTARLRALVQRVAAAPASTVVTGELLVPRSSSPRALAIRISPAPRQAPWAGGRGPAAIVVVIDPNGAQPAAEAALLRLFSLTRAESRVATELLAGRTVTETAAALGVSPSTIRTHLKRLFVKVGVRRQSELIRVLGTSGLWSPRSDAGQLTARSA